MDFEGFRAWLGAYVRACETNDPEDVRRRFAEYYPGPFDEPYRGSASIAEHWADYPWTVGPRFDAHPRQPSFPGLQGGTVGAPLDYGLSHGSSIGFTVTNPQFS